MHGAGIPDVHHDGFGTCEQPQKLVMDLDWGLRHAL
jgi:hypothetical protein